MHKFRCYNLSIKLNKYFLVRENTLFNMSGKDPFLIDKTYETDFEQFLKKLLMSHSNIQYEIEARIGKIYSKETESRIKIGTHVPIIFKKLPKQHVFMPGVDTWDFRTLSTGLNFKEHITDSFKYYKNGNRVRIVNNEYRFCEKKRKIFVVDIYIPTMKYDVRISVMTEEKQLQRPTTSTVDFIRYRDRYTYSDKYFNYDFTTVRKNDEVTYEIEIEVDDLNYNVDEFIKSFYRINVLK